VKVVLLAGGVGTRLSERPPSDPKPMVEIGDQPILWHIMKIYSAHGLNDFLILCGVQGARDQGLLRQLRHARVRCLVRPRPR